jgi:hypothetical protein
MCVSPEVIADVIDGSDYRKPDTRTHEQRELNETRRVRKTLEPARELLDDADAQYVGHVQDVAMDAIVGSFVSVPVRVQTSHCLRKRPLEVL